ncbi:hypothetical protein CLAFUW4_07223 [Fulvia fulva]|uniref:F-box domain-containing protein n=1 Tax=Passalora fulva TaxID=5499 RepID=A0A9Q8UQJ2_PASFU|nr:uncharacterized protein CLAFUR5_07356 [Fulvia fulva]KAK4622115.1 hypothetical protein CLAFUR4_07231 [Fulvia fulva]KAK4623182.1 hypothetical protein CLAFUR0_07228 [Fulvia fulva]UJO18834.1 hypothetical protein CLAFUR5_07356 [Fulvia fulva]WPV16137.1 hypothetical protein CLAFUW4_07223 [Fulvia fulva]WPV31679.1 hypothetical protein CLAFUW7_07224 [Fulvia fulva]
MAQETDDTGAGTTVFQTYELLENIMLRLSVKEILIVQRTAMHWRLVVQRSQDLQEKLFFKAAGEPIRPIQEDGIVHPRSPHSIRRLF